MECVLLMGIQASGKSTFYKRHFFLTHMRINLDMLKTRHREDIYLAASFQAKQKFVVDNTNPRREDRTKYIELARQFGFKVIGYYLEPDPERSIARNTARQGKEKVPAAAIRRTLRLLEPPGYEEGFDELYRVIVEEGGFRITPVTG